MFNLQMFGENDTLTSTSTMTFAYARQDTDTKLDGTFQKYKIPNPITEPNETTVKNAMQYAKENAILVNNKTGATGLSAGSLIVTNGGMAYIDNEGSLELDIS